MLSGKGTDSGLLVLFSVLAISQVVLLLVVILKVMDSVPRLDPIKIVGIKSSPDIEIRHGRTVQLPPVKVETDETTDHVP